MTAESPPSIDDVTLAQIEADAVELARKAGAILRRRFGTPQEVEYKDENKRDPVTGADRESQEFLAASVSKRYPDHGFIGEEGEEGDEHGIQPAPDFVWVVDPLDGTTNFVAGLPIYACSIGVLYKGAPVVGAIHVPWPGREDGCVLHARKGGGAFAEQEPVSIFDAEAPKGNRLITLPGAFPGAFRIDASLRGKIGEVRNTGSIAYDMAMAASGVLQYTVAIAPRLWDVAAGVILIMEAGGTVMSYRRTGGLKALASSRTTWETVETFIPSSKNGTSTFREFRSWSVPLIAGGPRIVQSVTGHLRRRRHWRRTLRLRKPSGG